MKKTAWTPRNRASLAKEESLRRVLKEIEDLAGWTGKKIAELEKQKARALGHSDLKSYHADASLSAALAKLEDYRRKLGAYEERIKSLRSEIENLQRVPLAEAAKRRKEQNQLAAIAGQRLKTDRAIDEKVLQLRELLQQRSGLTNQMKSLADSLGFTGDLDRTRFDDLLSSLPESVAHVSESWVAAFLGKGQCYMVIDDKLTVAETLNSLGICKFGDVVHLPDKEAAELLREDRKAPRHDAPWGLLPPSIVSLQEFKRATVEGRKSGYDRAVFELRHQEREQVAREAYEKTRQESESQVTPSEHRQKDVLGISTPI